MGRRSAMRLLAVGLLVILLSGCTQVPGEDDPQEPEPDADEGLLIFYQTLAEDRHVFFETDHGPVRLHLYESFMPVTTARFIELVESGFYDGTQVHRNVDRFVIQGGDPTGTGVGGSFENIPFERHEDLLFGAGALGLARDVDEDSGDSQWFITLTPQPHLSDPESETAEVFGTYALYGQVVEGMEVARAMNQVATIPGLDRPVEPPVVESAQVVDPPDDLDLLGLPRTISDRVSIAGHGVDVDRPLHLLAGHPFQVGVYLRETEDDSAPGEITLQYNGTFTTDSGAHQSLQETFTLRPTERDPWSFTGTVVLPRDGEWKEYIRLGSESGVTDEVEVHPWHADYGEFAG